MEQLEIRQLLQAVASGERSVDDALLQLKEAPFEDLGFAKLDHHRALRQGAAEVIYGAGKTPEQILKITQAMLAHGQKTVLITRLSKEAAEFLTPQLPLTYHELGKVGIAGTMPEPTGRGTIVIATGGTSDQPVAEEAALTAEALGNKVVRLYDVGVAGLHRLLSHTDDVMRAQAIVAIAGMEGALASVIGGLADCPVIAVPTSVGYGASFGGVAALLAMLGGAVAYYAIGLITVPDFYATAVAPNLTSDFFGAFKEFGTQAFGKVFTEGFDFSPYIAEHGMSNFIVMFLTTMLAFCMVDMFDTLGTLYGACAAGNMLTKDGNVPNMDKAMLADAIATCCGSVCGTSTVTTFVESSAGVAEGDWWAVLDQKSAIQRSTGLLCPFQGRTGQGGPTGS